MAKAWDVGKTLTLYALSVFVGMAMWSTLSAIPGAVPALYTQLRPVVQFGYYSHKNHKWEAPVQNLYRDNSKACWSLYSEKLSPATVVGYRFYALGGASLSAPIPTAAYIANEDSTPDKKQVLESHLVGEQWHRRWCFDLADRFPDFQSITITGEAKHARFPNLWETITPTPTFTMGPTN